MLIERGPHDDSEEFGWLIESHRRDTVLLCYRFLGSLHEAEEAAQETALRAWRARGNFRGEASMRTWLHRIATRVCLDLIDQRSRRPRAADGDQPSDPRHPPKPAARGELGIEPLPDDYLIDAVQDPAARYSLLESVSLAFLAAVQSLSARQRAILILRDVLAWSGAEVASTLGTSPSAVNSALHRARTTLRESSHRSGIDAHPEHRPTDPQMRALVERYVQAWQADDVDRLVAVLTEDVRLAMPPSPSWYQGPAAVAAFIDRWVLGIGARGRFRLVPIRANGQPAIGMLERQPDGGWGKAGVQVLRIERRGIAGIWAFMEPSVVSRFQF